MSKYLTAIDLGTTKVTTVVAERLLEADEPKIKIIAYEEEPVSGILRGEIFNVHKVAEALQATIDRAEEVTHQRITEAVVGVSGLFIKNETIAPSFRRSGGDNPVTQEELNKITSKAFSSSVKSDELIFEVIPQYYNIGDVRGRNSEEIIGMNGKEIEAHLNLIIGKRSSLKNREEVLRKCNIKVKKFILSPIASAKAVLSAAEMEGGVACIDIGGGLTEITIITNNIVREVDIIPFAGNSITEDIRRQTNITAKWAELLKCTKGCCIVEECDENCKLVLKGDNAVNEGEIEFKLFTEIIEARMSEILEAVRYVLNNSDFETKIKTVVLTGGTAYLENIANLAKVMLERKVRVGSPRRMLKDGSQDKSYDPYAATAIGLLIEGSTNEPLSYIEKSIETKTDELFPESHFDPPTTPKQESDEKPKTTPSFEKQNKPEPTMQKIKQPNKKKSITEFLGNLFDEHSDNDKA